MTSIQTVEGRGVCLEPLCGWQGTIAAHIRAAFCVCPNCGSPAGFMYRGGEKV